MFVVVVVVVVAPAAAAAAAVAIIVLYRGIDSILFILVSRILRSSL